MGRKYKIEIAAERVLGAIKRLIDEFRLSIRRVVYWLTKPSKNMADTMEKIAFIFLLISILLRARGY